VFKIILAWIYFIVLGTFVNNFQSDSNFFPEEEALHTVEDEEEEDGMMSQTQGLVRPNFFLTRL
jgi:hypothetical protein